MTDQLNAILTLIAIISGPLLALGVSRYLDDRRECRERRMDIFRTLMRTRRTPIIPDHVGALNLIEIEFQRDQAVLAAWRELLKHFGTEHPRRSGEERDAGLSSDDNQLRDAAFFNRLGDERQRLLAKLLHAMARVLNFKVEQLEIFEGGYTPQGWYDEMTAAFEIRKLLADVAAGRRSFPIAVTNLHDGGVSGGA